MFKFEKAIFEAQKFIGDNRVNFRYDSVKIEKGEVVTTDGTIVYVAETQTPKKSGLYKPQGKIKKGNLGKFETTRKYNTLSVANEKLIFREGGFPDVKKVINQTLDSGQKFTILLKEGFHKILKDRIKREKENYKEYCKEEDLPSAPHKILMKFERKFLEGIFLVSWNRTELSQLDLPETREIIEDAAIEFVQDSDFPDVVFDAKKFVFLLDSPVAIMIAGDMQPVIFRYPEMRLQVIAPIIPKGKI